jgi:hypothetical protein
MRNLCIVAGGLKADDIVLEGIDCRLIGAVVIHECTGRPTDALQWISTTPVVRQEGDDSVICISGFELNAAVADTEPEVDTLEIRKGMSACERLDVFECCLDRLACGQHKVEVWFDGRRVQYQEVDKQLLIQRIQTLQAKCDAERGCVTITRQRGDFSCA